MNIKNIRRSNFFIRILSSLCIASFLFSTLLPAEARDINIESPALGIQSPFQRAMLGAGIDVPSCVFDK
ncbi:MAG: hypothetical protein ABH883_05310, partial [Candidatus Omnitrophota bacterium]